MIVLIMAGGLGKRMNSQLPKVLHELDGKPMIYYVINQALKLNAEKIIIIVGKYKAIISETINNFFPNNNFVYIIQNQPLGTGNAIQSTIDYLQSNFSSKTKNVLILSGDVPLISNETLTNLLLTPDTILVAKLDNPDGCGRIIFSNDTLENVFKIIEHKDCSPDQLTINITNCGIYNMKLSTLVDTIPFITNNNAANEYYLTDMIEIANKKNIYINSYLLSENKNYEIANINTKEDLEKLKNSIL